MSSASWTGGLSLQDYVQKLYNSEASQVNARANQEMSVLNVSATQYQSTVTSETSMEGLLTALQQSITTLTTSFNPAYQASSSLSSVASVQIASGQTTTPGTHVLNVTQLAQAETVVSSNTALTTSAANALNITDGDALTFTVGSSHFNMAIKSTDSLNTIAQNINIGAAANNVGVSASVVQTGANQYQLMVSSTQTGASNAVQITESQNDLGIDTTSSKSAPYAGQVLTAGQDAQFTMDYVNPSNPGISFDQTSNTATINGLTINLLSLGSTTLSVTGSNSPANVASAAQNVVSSWNQIMNTIAQDQAGSSTNDPNLHIIQQSLMGMFQSNSSALSAVGITLTPIENISPVTTSVPVDSSGNTNGQVPVQYDPMGLLTFDSTKMTTALSNSSSFLSIQSQLVGAAKLDGTGGGVFTNVGKAIGNSAQSGSLQFSLTQTVARDNTQIASLKEQVATITANTQQQIKQLAVKYGKMALTLSKLQQTGAYLTQQASVNQGGG